DLAEKKARDGNAGDDHRDKDHHTQISEKQPHQSQAATPKSARAPPHRGARDMSQHHSRDAGKDAERDGEDSQNQAEDGPAIHSRLHRWQRRHALRTRLRRPAKRPPTFRAEHPYLSLKKFTRLRAEGRSIT